MGPCQEERPSSLFDWMGADQLDAGVDWLEDFEHPRVSDHNEDGLVFGELEESKPFFFCWVADFLESVEASIEKVEVPTSRGSEDHVVTNSGQMLHMGVQEPTKEEAL